MLYALVAMMGLGLADSYFISYLGTTQLAAIGFIVPITSIATSIALGLGMAISSLNSRLVGAGNLALAARLITDGFYLTGLVATVTVIALVWQLPAIFSAIGADAETLPYIFDYMFVWLFAAPLAMFSETSVSCSDMLPLPFQSPPPSLAAVFPVTVQPSITTVPPPVMCKPPPLPGAAVAGAAPALFPARRVRVSKIGAS